MRIAIFDGEPEEKAYFEQALEGHDVFFINTPLTMETLQQAGGIHAAECEVISIFIYSNVTEELLRSLPKLKVIATRSTGTDHIDTAACSQQGVQVYNVPTYGVHAVAEHAFALILALSRKLIPSVERTKKGNFHSQGLTGFELYGKTIGIVGYGNIGTSVGDIAKGFGMRILATSRSTKNIPGVTFVPLEELLKQSDVITIHTPLTPQTQHLINCDNIMLCKKGALLINTSRGPVIDTTAIIMALQKGVLGGAGLDVLEEEGSIREERELLTSTHIDLISAKKMLMGHVLQDMDNVIITPHNAFNSVESLEEINAVTVQNIQSALSKLT
ncbi:hydroxyacid dehydrogenase [Candidatus Roizmanbacteria bacterium CG10_big_fil_rev_8_21_14_0_10_45_7]|uniref:Hydroxyacid dehydrogenase n=1 Tax=Candidatus Roizmanbacteria bacterium CG10_big_fil_rev_8_21_14_0_10_45_7 TaxID=1974854 RepID=A0A2M8KU29_9BACT|nr:MAG: hydroxyacid dehydrogenase [Candidatus Roizmanbacteria bacterium CG10_big_fil_rev_8_21_14_0_10_45_7]